MEYSFFFVINVDAVSIDTSYPELNNGTRRSQMKCVIFTGMCPHCKILRLPGLKLRVTRAVRTIRMKLGDM